MAKISELVKTYRFLSDPNAPEWNVKFVGGIVIALALLAAAGATLWGASQRNSEGDEPAAASMPDEPGDLATCDPTEVAQEMAKTGATTLPKGTTLPSGCVIG
ncbi:MAG TPA: hypothetical protein VM370_11125 [Candidatus Thermoplasmatota archaeon]|nr:hypothetical protein [Candidatus Thermoplasmatota archaeon]